MAPKKADSNIVVYKDKAGRQHYASRTSPKVVKGLESGEFKLVEDGGSDAPTVPAAGNAPNPRPAGNGS